MLNSLLEKELSHREYQRYARQIILQNINLAGQQRLKKAKVICVGAGGLNTPTLLYLAACGVGTIGIIDNDTIEISNLQRQILYKTCDVNKLKSKVAYNHIKSLNPLININSYTTILNQNNIKKILYYYDIVIDGTDNLKIRYLLSQYCYKLHKIHIYGAINEFIGQISVFNYQNSTNYYQLYNQISYRQTNTCQETGIINTLAGVVGTLQATEAIKIITGIGIISNKNLMFINLIDCSLDQIKIRPNKIKNHKTTKSQTKQKKSKKQYISIKDIENNINTHFKLIDIRKPIEFKLSHIENAVNIPLNILKKQSTIQYINQLKNCQIVIYCNNQIRSYLASQILKKYKINHYILKHKITIS